MFSNQFQSPFEQGSILGNSHSKLKEAELPSAIHQFSMFERVSLREKSFIDIRGFLPQTYLESRVVDIFFSKKNVAALLIFIKQEILKMSNNEISIPIENPKKLLSAMNFIYETQRGPHLESSLSAIQQVELLNKRVLEFIVPHIYNQAVSYSLFLQMQNNSLNILLPPIQVDRDFKHLQFK